MHCSAVMSRVAAATLVVTALDALGASLAVAQPKKPPPAPVEEQPRDVPYWVNFQAGRVEADPEMQRLELDDDVVVQVDRYRLRSEHLILTRGPRGIVVDGEGRVAFCPCENAPIEFGFDRATVAPPTDLVLEQPTLRVGGVPVFWLPYLWLRSPSRFGLLAPEFAWRGSEGLLAGAGVHIPFNATSDAPPPAALDIRAAGYFKGGARVSSMLMTPSTSTAVVWDHLNSSVMQLDAQGSRTGEAGATLAWRAEALRGRRSRQSTISLEQAARRYDRASIDAAGAEHGGVWGMGVEWQAERGGSFDAPGTFGPLAHVGYGGAVGNAGSADTSIGARTLYDRDRGTASLLLQRGELLLAARPGPFGTELALVELVDGAVTRDTTRVALHTGARAHIGLPLGRQLGAEIGRAHV